MELHIALQKNFGSFTLDVDSTLRGNRIGVFGPSGSGKSTLVSLIAGLQQAQRGRIVLDGDLLYDTSRRINVSPDKRRIGIIFQRPHLFPHLNVKNNLLYGFKRSTAGNCRIDFDTLTDVLRINHLLGRGVNNLSGGEKQRVAIGRAVLSNPRLLLMDEPLSGLDDTLRFQIISYLKSACEIFAIPSLFISHSLLEMRLMTDQVLSIEQGRIVEETTPENLSRSRMGLNPAGYVNLLKVTSPTQREDMCAYSWGNTELLISGKNDQSDSLFELSSKDIILFKRHPEAISARNLLQCVVSGIFESGGKVGIELGCGDERLVAEVVHQVIGELDITVGSTLFAAIKASAFRRLG